MNLNYELNFGYKRGYMSELIKNEFKIDQIPAILWGEKSSKVYIFVHGKLSSKADAQGFAEKVCPKGYQVLSFDLPEHGDRKEEMYECNVWNGVHDLGVIKSYVLLNWKDISLFAGSLGAYFSLLSFYDLPLKNCLFLSPILNMEQLIRNMMLWFQVEEKTLKEKKEIPTPMGETLSWEYFTYVKDHPIVYWNIPTAILYGSEDNLQSRDLIDEFTTKFQCRLTVLQGGEHHFHTPEQIEFMFEWIDQNT
jgi:esterase/lipase